MNKGGKRQLVVIGGGAAGLFCAVNAARMDPSLSVTVLEKTNKLLSKVKVSGGGRCNVTHACYDIADMAKRYPRGHHFVRKAFHQWFTTDTIQWFEDRGVRLKTEEDGRMFPVTDSSQTIIDCLMREAEKTHVGIRMKTEAVEIARIDHEAAGMREGEAVIRASGLQELPSGPRFRLQLSGPEGAGSLTAMEAEYICIACGGYPRSAMFQWIERTGHTIEPPVPSLFTFNMPGHPIRELMGVSVPDAQVKIAGAKLHERGPILITHWGLSGPAILRLSAWGARELAAREYRFPILVNWLPEYNEQTIREQFHVIRAERGAQKAAAKNPFGLPQRLWEYCLAQAGIAPESRWADMSGNAMNSLSRQLCYAEFNIQGKTTFKEEFVTAGGVKLSEVDPATMQSRKVPGLFFAGEILDVDGITGGFNFQHAWTSGHIAAKAVAGRL